MPPIEYIGYLLIIATGFVVGLTTYDGTSKMKPVTMLLGVTLVSETTSWILRQTIKFNTPVFHVFTPIQIILWALFFLGIVKNKAARKSIYFLGAGLLFFAVLNVIFWQGWKVFPDNVLKLESVFLVYLALVLCLQLLEESSKMQLFKNPMFIIVTAILWFNLVSFLFFQLHNYFLRNQLSGQTLRALHYVSNYVFYSLILVAVLLSRHAPPSQTKYR